LEKGIVIPIFENAADDWWYHCVCLNKYMQHPEVFSYPIVQETCPNCGAVLDWENILDPDEVFKNITTNSNEI
jgi:hypothetical protein